MPEIGDIKVTLLPTQTRGWFALDGQTIANDPVAEASALQIFSSTTLPDFTDKYLKQSAVILEAVGSNSVTLTQAHLPKIKVPLTHDTGVLERVNLGITPGATIRFVPQLAGTNRATLNASEVGVVLNPNATQTSYDNRPPSVGVKYMVYLNTSVPA